MSLENMFKDGNNFNTSPLNWQQVGLENVYVRSTAYNLKTP